MSSDAVQLEVDGKTGVLFLNRAPRNTMTAGLMGELVARLDEIRHSKTLRALVVTSRAGHFCAGAELSGGLPGVVQPLGGPAGVAVRLREIYQPFLSILDLPIPTVAAVRGAAVGGGFGLSLMCDLRVVSPSTRFLAPFGKLGFHPGVALTHLLPTLVGLPRAMEVLLLGEEISGETALAWGMANRCVPEDELLPTALELARRLAANAPAVMRLTKRATHRGAGLDVQAAADSEALAQALTFQSKDAAEGMRAFLGKRPPEFTGE